jgi:superfamily I DNA/RNA helicase
MRKVVVYTGQAGTGKTTSLIKLLSEIIPQREWLKFEAILALTFMHGSRRRLESNLKFIKPKFKVRCECSTFDSFALHLVNRFRYYLNINKPIHPNDIPSESVYENFMTLEMIKNHSIQLLRLEPVRNFLSNSYPLIVIDEFQDCTGSLLEIVKQLSNTSSLFIASDQFQQLHDPEDLEGQKWLQENQFDYHDLDSTGVKRTTNNKILTTATCLRIGAIQTGPKIKIYACPGGKGGSFHLAEYQLKANLHYYLGSGNVAIISPTQSSTFISQLLNSLSTPYTYKKAPFKTIGPYNHLLGTNKDFCIEELLVDLPKGDISKAFLKELKEKPSFVLKRVAEKLLKRFTLRNLETIPNEEFCYVLKQTGHNYDSFYRQEHKAKIIFTTVHGAKNREFDNVIVLWPYKVSGNLLKKRKLLYNAITRAKRNAILIVQSKTTNIQDLRKDDLFGLIIDEKSEDESTTI